MGITGKNLEKSVVALISSNIIVAGNSTNESSYITSPRQACQVLEVGVTVTKDAGSVINRETIWQLNVYDKNNEGGTTLANGTFADTAKAGDEITTRDGSFVWVADYANASDRIFAKGARLTMKMTTTSDSANDIFAPYVIAIPNGAEPL